MAAAFGVTIVTGVALLAVYATWADGIEGVLPGPLSGQPGPRRRSGRTSWLTRPAIEERQPFASSARPAISEVIDAEAGFTRRTFLVRMFLGALAGLEPPAIPALSPAPAPGRELFTTSWATGRRLVDIDGIGARGRPRGRRRGDRVS